MGKKFLTVALLMAATAFILRVSAPPIDEGFSYSRIFFDRHEKLLRITLSADEKYRLKSPLTHLDPKLVQAFLLKEDRYFYWHPGVNLIALAKALGSVVTHKKSRGASTLTMQLARLRAHRNTTTIAGKLSQIVSALWLELRYSKQDILEQYLSLAPFGANVEGVAAAAQIYFGKSAKKLSLAEALSLALIPQSPSFRSLDAPAERLNDWQIKRQNLFTQWLRARPQDRDQSLEINLPLISSRLSQLPFEAPHFIYALQNKFPEQREFKTSLDLHIQKFLEKRLHDYVEQKKPLGVSNAAALLLNYESNQIEAYVGSADFFDNQIQGQVDGIQARRSPGSALKPFVYALALEQGLIHPQTLLKDTPISFGSFDPENFDRSFLGPLHATDALVHSRNVPAIWLASQLQAPNMYEFLKSQQIPLKSDPKYYGLSVALGGAEISMEEAVRLYAALARQAPPEALQYLRTASANKNEPFIKPNEPFIKQKGPFVRQPEPFKSIQSWPISPEASFLTLDMLSANPRDDSERFLKWSRSKLDMAWKTGTSAAFRDAWTVGVFGPYVLAIWLGNFSGETNPAFVGRELAAPLFFEVAEGLRSFKKISNSSSWQNHFRLNLKKVKVCALSGGFSHGHCPHETQTWIIPGKSPIAFCDIHQQLLIAKTSGKRVCHAAGRKDLAFEVFEFWPSDLLKVFKDFGIRKPTPPDFESTCDGNYFEVAGRPPEIISPKKEVTYSLRLNDPKNAKIPMMAITHADAKTLSWFAENQFIGQSTAGTALLWAASAGHHVITVVDDFGRSDRMNVEVQTVE